MTLDLRPRSVTPREFEGVRVTYLEERFGSLRPAAWLPYVGMFVAGVAGAAFFHTVWKALDWAWVTAARYW